MNQCLSRLCNFCGFCNEYLMIMPDSSMSPHFLHPMQNYDQTNVCATMPCQPCCISHRGSREISPTTNRKRNHFSSTWFMALNPDKEKEKNGHPSTVCTQWSQLILQSASLSRIPWIRSCSHPLDHVSRCLSSVSPSLMTLPNLQTPFSCIHCKQSSQARQASAQLSKFLTEFLSTSDSSSQAFFEFSSASSAGAMNSLSLEMLFQ